MLFQLEWSEFFNELNGVHLYVATIETQVKKYEHYFNFTNQNSLDLLRSLYSSYIVLWVIKNTLSVTT